MKFIEITKITIDFMKVLKGQKSLSTLKAIIENIDQLGEQDKEVLKLKKYYAYAWTILYLIKSSDKLQTFSYGEVAKETNKQFPQLDFPESGGSLSRMSAVATGILSTISFESANLLISSLIVNKNDKTPSKGFFILAAKLGWKNRDISHEQQESFRFVKNIVQN